jgi:hypothetical protein
MDMGGNRPASVPHRKRAVASSHDIKFVGLLWWSFAVVCAECQHKAITGGNVMPSLAAVRRSCFLGVEVGAGCILDARPVGSVFHHGPDGGALAITRTT